MRREVQVVTLEVRISNAVAITLYEKYGFSVVGIRRGYYSDNVEDATIMTTDKLNSDEYHALLMERIASFSERYGETTREYLG